MQIVSLMSLHIFSYTGQQCFAQALLGLMLLPSRLTKGS